MKGKEKTAEVNVGKIRHAVVKLIRFLLNPRLLLCLGLGWMITNGWAYILFGVGNYCDIGWMTVVSGSYLAFLWVPFTPEKIVTIAIAIVLLRRLFPKDEKTLAVLIEAYHKAKVKLGRRRRRKNVVSVQISERTARAPEPSAPEMGCGTLGAMPATGEENSQNAHT